MSLTSRLLLLDVTENGPCGMSALGQKQTYAVQNGMSALPPKADSRVAQALRTTPLTDSEQKMMAKYPYFGGVIENEFFALPRALKALELKPSSESEDKIL